MTPMLRPFLLSLTVVLLAACGGGGGGGSAATGTGTVGIALTDDPVEGFDQALATINAITLLGDDGNVTVFNGMETVDLLKLADYAELFAVRDDVPVGTYNKIRLQLSRLELVRLDATGAVAETVVPRLVANGKIDLNPQGPFVVAPGTTLVVTVDFDVGKSLKITETGNGTLIVRPVVFVDISNGLPTPGLARIHGEVASVATDGSFRLCQTRFAADDDDEPLRFGTDERRCVRVVADADTGVFGEDGLPEELFDVAEGDEFTAIGRLRPVPRDDDEDDPADRTEYFALTAVLLEEGPLGTFERLRGVVTAAIDAGTDRFLLDVAPGQGILADAPLAAQLYPKSRIFSPAGLELGRLDIEAGSRTLIDAVLVLSDTGPDVLRTPLVILKDADGSAELVLSGPLVAVDAASGELIVAAGTGDRCVDARSADIFLIDDDGGALESERGTLADLAPGQLLNVFGAEGSGGCLVAETILARR